MELFATVPVEEISIHAPRGGSDNCGGLGTCPPGDFNPRSPWGERPANSAMIAASTTISIHAPRGGSDQIINHQIAAIMISIHAPRGGSDTYAKAGSARGGGFQSTLPVGGATSAFFDA